MDENEVMMNEVPEENSAEECADCENGVSNLGFGLLLVATGAAIGAGIELGRKVPGLVNKGVDWVQEKHEERKDKRAAKKAARAKKHDKPAVEENPAE